MKSAPALLASPGEVEEDKDVLLLASAALVSEFGQLLLVLSVKSVYLESCSDNCL